MLQLLETLAEMNNMTYKTISTHVEVDVDLDDFDDDDLIDTLENRGYTINDAVSSPDLDLLEFIGLLHQQRRTGQDYQKTLDDLIYHTIGKIV
jgi:DNA-binding winged helix-turn-helix (wHTH) protein